MTIPASESQVLFADDFSAPLDSNNWDYNHFSSINNPSFYGRTQIRQSLPSVSGGSVHLALNTFNPTGFSFYGSEMITRQNFSTDAAGIAFEASARLVTPTAGIVGGFFGYNHNGTTNLNNELDTEVLGNDAATGRNQYLTNDFKNEGPLTAGHPQSASTTSSITNFHVYRMEWQTSRVRWFVDGQLVREDTANVPQGPMALHANIWAPDANFAAAYSALLQPTSNPAADAAFFFDIDYVRVARLSTLPRIIQGTTGADLIFGGQDRDPSVPYDEIFFGNGGADIIYGNGGNDWIWGAVGDASADTFYGGDGDDVLDSFNGNDWLEGNNGNDILISGAGNDTLLGGPGNDQLWGAAGLDSLYGFDGNDILVGADSGQPEESADYLDGGDDNDILIGGRGANILSGGNGDDQLWSIGTGDSLNGDLGMDLIVSMPAASIAGAFLYIDPGLDTVRDQIILESDGTRPQNIVTGGQSAVQTLAGTDLVWNFSTLTDHLQLRSGDHTGSLQSTFQTFAEFGGLTGTLLTNGGTPIVFLAGTNTSIADLAAKGALVLL